MASKSRLGRGLGALFPTLPDEQEFQHEAQAAKPEPTKPEPAKKTTARKAAKKAPSKPSKAATEPKKAPYDPEAYADVDGPISPLSSTIPSMGAMTIHAETVNKLSAAATGGGAPCGPAARPPVEPGENAWQARDDACDLIHDPPPERHVLRRHPAGGHGEA